MALAEQPPWDPKFESQRQALIDAFHQSGSGIEVEIGYADDGTPVTVHQAGHLLIRAENADADLEAVKQAIPTAKFAPGEASRLAADGAPETGVVRISLGTESLAADQVLKALTARERLDTTVRPGIATLNHIVSIAPTGTCPANEPAAAGTPPNPNVNPNKNAGAGVTVKVIDTGLVPDVTDSAWLTSHPWMGEGVEFDRGEHSRSPTGPSGPDLPPPEPSRNPADPLNPLVIREYAGHGTFIAGVVKCVAPGTRVVVSNALQNAGAVPEDQLGTYLLKQLPDDEPWPEIISLSAGACSDGDKPLKGLEQFIARLGDHEETVLVAAAGNHGNQVPFWPAALAGEFPESEPVPGVISVGALRYDGKGRACFSNYGPWVSVYAPGEELVNAFTANPTTYLYRDPPFEYCRYFPKAGLYRPCTCTTAPPQCSCAEISGMASWSGTSFSTPIVAAMIANRMREEDESSRDAATALLAGADFMEGVGLVLFPPGWTPLNQLPKVQLKDCPPNLPPCPPLTNHP